MKYVAAGMNPMDLKRGIDKAVEATIAELKENCQTPARPARKSRKSAHFRQQRPLPSANASPKRWTRSARKVSITIEDGKSLNDELDIVEGMQFDRGYLSPYFINNADKQVVALDNPYILLYEKKISNIRDLLPVLEQVAKASRPLLIIAEDVEGEALATLVVNNIRGILKTCAVKAPGIRRPPQSHVGRHRHPDRWTGHL